MARPKIPGVSVLLVVALVLVVAEHGIASKREPISTLSRVPPLLDCGPAPVAPPAAGESDGAFRANLLSLLRDIPSVAATAPEGFVTARSGNGTTGRGDRTFARALCFGGASPSSSSSGGCRACLTAAARDTTGGCGTSRRAGVWRAGCFLSYADTEALSAREEAFRGWFYAADPDTTAATLQDRVCAGDSTGPDCDRCFEDAVRAAAAALPWLVRMRREVIVVGYSCSLRVHSYVLPIDILDARRYFLFFMVVMAVMAEMLIVAEALILIVITLRGEETVKMQVHVLNPCPSICSRALMNGNPTFL